jgi:putative membrane protein
VKIITYITLLILIVFGVTFAIINPASVTVNYYFGTGTYPLSLLLIAIFALGCLVGLIMNCFSLMRVKFQNYQLNKKIKTLEEELQNLRTMPLLDRQ